MYFKEDYKISVPVINRVFMRQGREAVVASLRRLGATRVFLGRDIYTANPQKRSQMLAELQDNCAYLKAQGFEVGIWGWSFLMEEGNDTFLHIKSLNGKSTAADARCPLDSNFRKFVGAFSADLARTGADIIMLDDDYRLAYWSGTLACGCEKHMSRFREVLGEDVNCEELKKRVLSGGRNKYRDAYLQINRETLSEFAAYLRKCVDEVNPQVRIGICACMNWDMDGIDPASLSRILAGNTKPLLRLIGAVYWPTQPRWSIYNRLGAVIEFERMERSWCGDGIEVITEGDSYPRPRFAVPSSYMELFDTALIADGRMDGILKYALDYTADPRYERGYVEAHCRNRELRKELLSTFAPKTACGMRIYEKMQKFRDMEVPDELAGDDVVLSMFYSPGAKMLSSLSIPSVYEGSGICGVVFGENARDLDPDAFQNGLILDLRAAEILQSAGVDTGIRHIGRKIKAPEEYFVDDNMYVAAGFSSYEIRIDPQCTPESYFVYQNGLETVRTPASYRYENGDGQKFLVFAFNMHYNDDKSFRSYCRGRQLIRCAEFLSGKPLPATIENCPDLYIMCKKGNDGRLAVGLWNIFADPVYEPVITLDQPYASIRFIQCSGRLEGNKVYLSRLEPFAFAGIEVTPEEMC